MNEWGTAHALFHEELFRKLIWFHAGQIEFEYTNEWGEDDLMLGTIHSPHLPSGYHGQMDIITEDGLRFKRDCDV